MVSALARSVIVAALSGILVGSAMLSAGEARAQSASVVIQNFSFMPPSLTVPVGATVTWTNQDTAPHTSTSDTGVWESGALSTGQSFSFTFNQPGTFPYHCMIHPGMLGTVVVQTAATPTATPSPTTTPQPAPSSTPSRGKSKTVVVKEIQGRYAFRPQRTTGTVGTRIVWKNTSDAPHTVTSRTKGWTYDKVFGQNKSVSLVFKKAGTYRYYCKFHPYMTGRIIIKRR